VVEIRLVKHRQRLADGRPIGERRDDVVVTWHR
jgi:hypothetical protein